jgi:hypothetical protein
MLTLTPSMCTGFVGGVLSALAMAADWYLWGFRIPSQNATQSAPSAEGEAVIHVPSTSGRELVVALAPQSFDRSPLDARRVEERMAESASAALSH